MKKRLLALTLVLAVVLGLAACGGNNTEEGSNGTQNNGGNASQDGGAQGEANYRDRLVIGNNKTLYRLDPRTNNNAVNGQIYALTHSTLLDYNYTTMDVQGDLAYKWEQEDDLTYIFYIHDDVYFTGDYSDYHCTVNDVIWSLERAREDSHQEAKLQDIDTMEAIDDYTLKITLKTPNAEFLINTTYPGTSILCQKAVEEMDEDTGCMVGTGPYELTDWMLEDYCLVTRNENYFGEPGVSKEILYRAIPEESARTIALQTGEIDICMNLPNIEASVVESDPNLNLHVIDSAFTDYITLNVTGTNEALLEPKVREAIHYAINPEELIVSELEGYGTVPHSIVPENVWGYTEVENFPTYDVEKAKALLAEAGYEDGVDLTLSYDGSSYNTVFAVLQAQLAQANIRLTMSTNDNAVRLEQEKNNSFEAILRAWGFDTINDYFQSLWLTDAGSNVAGWSDPEMDEKMAEAVRISDPDERLAIYAELNQESCDANAIIPLYHAQTLIADNKNVVGADYSGNRIEFAYVGILDE